MALAVNAVGAIDRDRFVKKSYLSIVEDFAGFWFHFGYLLFASLMGLLGLAWEFCGQIVKSIIALGCHRTPIHYGNIYP